MRDSTPWGQVRIRQVYSRRGKSYCAITLPIATMKLLKWEPGQLLSYYPTTKGGLGFILATDLLNQLDDFDEAGSVRESKGEPWKEPREGSMDDSLLRRSVDVDGRLWEMSRSLGKGAAQSEERGGERTSRRKR